MPDEEQPAPEDDGLVIPDVGEWALKKHHFLRRYIDAFTKSMKGKWKGLHYIDLFASAGLVRVEGHGLTWGSPMLAARSKYPFSRIHACEMSPERCSALESRLKLTKQAEEPRVLCGDANELVQRVMDEVPKTSLNLAFVDPHGVDTLHFETLRALASRRTDLIVFFPDLLDMVRNVPLYMDRSDSHLSRFLGTTEWTSAIEKEPRENWPHVLVSVFKSQMKPLGYAHFEEERISRGDSNRLYKLVFCSADPTGAKLWRAVSKKHFGGQMNLFG